MWQVPVYKNDYLLSSSLFPSFNMTANSHLVIYPLNIPHKSDPHTVHELSWHNAQSATFIISCHDFPANEYANRWAAPFTDCALYVLHNSDDSETVLPGKCTRLTNNTHFNGRKAAGRHRLLNLALSVMTTVQSVAEPALHRFTAVQSRDPRPGPEGTKPFSPAWQSGTIQIHTVLMALYVTSHAQFAYFWVSKKDKACWIRVLCGSFLGLIRVSVV